MNELDQFKKNAGLDEERGDYNEIDELYKGALGQVYGSEFY